MRRHWLPGLLLGLCCLGLPVPLRAQTPKPAPRYVTIPFDGNVGAMLKEQLRRAGELNRWQDFLKQFDQIDPQNFEVFKQLLAKMRENPQVVDPKKIESLGLKKPDLEKLVANPDLKEILDKTRQGADLSPDNIKNAVENALQKVNPSPESAPVAAPTPRLMAEEKWTRWLQDRLKEVDGSRLGDLLRDSPAWQRGLRDLERLWQNSSPGSNWQPPSFLKDLDLSLPDIKLPELPDLPLPSLPRLNLNFDGWRPSVGGLPNLQAPSVTTLSQLLLVGGVVLVLVLLGREYVTRRRLVAAHAGWQLGPWPVLPSQVASRAQLIAAFEHLSLLSLGREARSWNHRTIADQLAHGNESRRAAARQLADLYEQARYTPEETDLAPQALETARRHLCFLAGVAS